MKIVKFIHSTKHAFLAAALTITTGSAWAVTLTKMSSSSLPGDVTEIRLQFDGTPPKISGYTIDQPARIAIDMPDTVNQLGSKRQELGKGNAHSAMIVSTKDRARLVINLAKPVGYISKVDGNAIVLQIGQNKSSTTEVAKPASSASTAAKEMRVVNVDFRRGEQNEGQVQIMLNDAKASANVRREGRKIIAELQNVVLPDNLSRRIDVTDFATVVNYIDSRSTGKTTRIIIEPKTDNFEFLSYQTDRLLSINVTTPPAEKKQQRNQQFPFTGEKLSLNFQNIDVRAVLQIIADFTGLNLVASDTVNGTITLRLQNVPWDQALDLVLKTKGLGKRQMGSVMLIAPADEIASREKVELETMRQVEELAPLMTEYIQIRYAKASQISKLLSSEQGLLSDRGSAVVDERTNTLLMKDTAGNLEKIREVVSMLDVPVRQVLIEARIVVASTTVGDEMGVKWGGGGFNRSGKNVTTWGGKQQTIGEANQIPFGGKTLNDIDLNAANMMNFGVNNTAASTFAVGYQTADYLLDLELAAIETEGRGEIVSQPRVITADGQTASIESGTEIPYQEASSSGATSVSFKDAVLRLQVTPQITPDDRIIMDLNINQDSVGEYTVTGVPTINTNRVQTQVLVNNGETIVLGGIFRSEEVHTINKTPLLGDIPLLGALFRYSSYDYGKSELLVFITPKLVKETLTSR